MDKIVNWFLLTLFLISFLNCDNEDIIINDSPSFEEYVQEEMSFQKIPAMSLLIFREDRILYEKYLGNSNLQQNTPLSEEHLFLLASVSKMITATALLQLYEDGLFRLEDNINDYLPFQVSNPGKNSPITFKMLLTHTSGIADGSALDNQYYYGEDSPVALDYFMENYLVPGGAFYKASENFHDIEPGSDYMYSNVGSALIGVLVAQLSNKDFNTYCKENIFNPLNMSHTFWRLDESVQSNYGIVQPYNYTNNQFESIQHYTFTDYPNGGLRSTGKDLFKFLHAFVQGGNSNNYPLLNSSTVEMMNSPQISSIDNEVGLHLFLMDRNNELWGHDGGEQGVATIVAFNKETKTGVIILTNQGDADLDEILVEAYKLGLKL